MTGPVTPGREPRRLSPLTPFVRAPIVMLAVVGGSWQQLLKDGDVGTTALAVLVLLAAGAVYGIVSWLRTTYWIDDAELRIDKGVIARQSRRIRIDRLQGVDIVQPLLARLFGLAELRFDVASGADREGSLAFLPHREALALRATLLRRRDDLRGDSAGRGGTVPADAGTDEVAAAAAVAAAGVEPERLLGRLDLGLLLASTVVSPEALVTLVVLGALVVSVSFTGTLAIAGGLAPATFALAVATARRLTAYYGFRLTHSAAGLHVSRGLTALSSQTIAPHRVQGLVMREPLFWRPFGWARLEVSVAGYASSDVDRVQPSSTLMPVAPRAECLALMEHVLGSVPETAGSSVPAVPLVRPPRRSRWRAPVTWWTLAFGWDEQLVVSRRGLLSRRLDVVPMARVQSVRLVQGPWRRLLRLADLRVDSPPGPVEVVGLLRDGDRVRAEGERVALAARTARRRASAEEPGPHADGGANVPLL